jgi:hypothetical protein
MLWRCLGKVVETLWRSCFVRLEGLGYRVLLFELEGSYCWVWVQVFSVGGKRRDEPACVPLFFCFVGLVCGGCVGGMGREPEPRGKMAFLVAPQSPRVMGFRLGPSDFPSTVPQLALHIATFVGELCMYFLTFSVCDPGGLTPGGGVVLDI